MAVFPGRADPRDLNFLERWMMKNLKAPVGDLRDWGAITYWAGAIAVALKEGGPA